ncbi:MAG: hybrid sensor histidine kinase/response regulator [Kofleriaceae bacterium]
MPKLGIRAYLLIVLGILSSLPTLVLSAITAERTSSAQRELADRDNRARAGAVARELDELIASQRASIELLAGEVEAIGGLDSPLLQRVLTEHRRHAPQLAFTYIADREGTSLVADPPLDRDGAPNAGTSYRDRDYYRELIATGQTTISRVQRGRRSGVPNVQVVAPIHDEDGGMIGFAEGSIDLHRVAESVAHALRGASDSRVIVTDGHGRVLADSSGRLEVLADVSELELLAPSPDAQVRSVRDEQRRPVRIAHATLTRTVGWTVVAVRDEAAIAALASAARRDARVITAIALAIALGVVAFGVHWLARPIRALAAATSAIGRGDFTREVPAARRFEARELAELLASVRQMTRDVRHHRDATSALIRELEAVNDELETMVVGIEHAGNAIEVIDAEGRVTYVNAAWERFTGYAAAEVTGRRFVEVLGIDDELFAALWATLTRGAPWRGIYAGCRRDGTAIEVELDALPVMRSDGAISHVVATRVDIGAQRRAEEVMRVNDRLAAVGTLAAGVAHEINNPLTYVATNLEILREAVEAVRPALGEPGYAEAITALDETGVGIDRVTHIVRDLRRLSRPDERSTTAIDLDALVESCVRMASLEIRHRAAVECRYGAPPRVAGNEARLSQVFLNLLINAAQACSVEHRATHAIRIATRGSPDGAHAIVEISDTGRGIEPDVIERIFDAFFTTKPIGVGTGLGLSICHGIVKQHDGTIEVESEPGRGATFRVALPAMTGPQRAALVAPTATVHTARIRLLVVDDEVSIARSLERMLREHDVTVAHSARAALALLERTRFDVVLSDVMMPDIDGVELYRRACLVEPRYARAFLFMTGGIVQPQVGDELAALGPPTLFKPFTRQQVLAAIAEVSGANRSAIAG